MSDLLSALTARPLLSDGAMGTQLQQAGLEPGGCGEAWNVDHPDRVLAIHRAYVEAGADLVTTNTFGASRIMLVRHGEGERTVAINSAGARLARQAGARFVLGDIGPFGGLLEPLGDAHPDAVRAAFTEQARCLVEAGVDAILVETQTALEELDLGIEAARAAGAPLVVGSMAFDRLVDGEDARTMMGVGPEDAARFMEARGVDILAFNCGADVDMVLGASIARRYRAVSGLPILGQPNAGTPVLENLKVVYHETPAHMAAGVVGLLDAGARIVGGCCGSTPAHIAAFRAVLDAR